MAQKSTTVASLLEQAPRIARILEMPGVVYLGACIVQAPGAWSRVGPTWRVPNMFTIVIGPGLARWGTTKGLAELAVAAADCKPEWHAMGIAICETPNIVFAITAKALAAKVMSEVATLAAEVGDPET